MSLQEICLKKKYKKNKKNILKKYNDYLFYV